MLLNILSPTDCCRDRLAHFLFWNDRAALAQALAVARSRKIDLVAIEAWCRRLDMPDKFREFARLLGP